ncbi:MAG: PhoH family protein [Christensenellaceae bacterium]|nr:PhoH family protein [Christensenellaceae bacterium]
MLLVFGELDENIRKIEKVTGAMIRQTQEGVEITGDAESTAMASDTINNLLKLIRNGELVDENTVSYILDAGTEGNQEEAVSALADVIAITHRGRPVKCKSIGQKQYIKAIENNTVVFGIGPAGTGKTYLAMAKAVIALKNKQVSRIILTRPAVEAGEKLGFLPGDLQNKVDPYLRPLYDALYDFMGTESYARLAEKGVIEVAPLAYMRGRTLNDAFIILDEAQNCTLEQMKMFLTRFGEGSKVVITGDVTQIDLPEERKSGLAAASQILSGVEGIETIQLTHRDVVRHKLVKDIVKAFEKNEKRKQR